MKRILLICAVAFVALPCFAAKRYKVQVIVFSKVNATNLQSEHWKQQLLKPHIPGLFALTQPQTDDAKSKKDNASKVPNYQDIKKMDANWKWIFRRMKRSGYQILANMSWVQPGDSNGKWVHVQGGTAYDATGKETTPPDTDDSDARPEVADSAIPAVAYWQLNGGIKVSISRYIFVSSQLYLTLPTSQVFGVSSKQFGSQYGLVPLQSFPLVQTQRVYLDQYLYFDNPLYGALVYISPVTTT